MYEREARICKGKLAFLLQGSGKLLQRGWLQKGSQHGAEGYAA